MKVFNPEFVKLGSKLSPNGTDTFQLVLVNGDLALMNTDTFKLRGDRAKLHSIHPTEEELRELVEYTGYPYPSWEQV